VRLMASGDGAPADAPGPAEEDGGPAGPVGDGFDVGGHGGHPSWEQAWPMQDRFACGVRRNPAGECSAPVRRRLDGPPGAPETAATPVMATGIRPWGPRNGEFPLPVKGLGENRAPEVPSRRRLPGELWSGISLSEASQRGLSMMQEALR